MKQLTFFAHRLGCFDGEPQPSKPLYSFHVTRIDRVLKKHRQRMHIPQAATKKWDGERLGCSADHRPRHTMRAMLNTAKDRRRLPVNKHRERTPRLSNTL